MSSKEACDLLREIRDYLRQEREPKPMTIDEASAYLGLARSTVYKLTCRAEIPHFKIASGKELRFLQRDLDSFLLKHRVKTREEIREEVDRERS